MRFSINWLREYAEIDAGPSEVADALTMAGLEVEALIKRYAPLDNVVVARVVEAAPHPNADRLTVCTVDDGSGTRRVVCGAPNVRPGMLSPLALPGAKLPNGMKIKPGKLRGVVSEGMLCAEDELGLSENHDGIMDLPADLAVGSSIYRRPAPGRLYSRSERNAQSPRLPERVRYRP